eukprot:scaffold159162_cov35-Attheya_sp.AAC.1
MFVKTFSSASDFESEAAVLRVLNTANVYFVPRLLETTENDGVGAILASPVCTPLETLQGRSIVWVLGQKLVDCLESAHHAGLCHRDIRPSNMGYIRTTVLDEYTEPLLFDWASAANIGSSPEYVGTVHYAAYEVLEFIKDSRDPVLKAAHDLESLVYSIYDVSKEPATRPHVLAVQGSLQLDARAYATEVQLGWAEENMKVSMAELIGYALRKELLHPLGRQFRLEMLPAAILIDILAHPFLALVLVDQCRSKDLHISQPSSEVMRQVEASFNRPLHNVADDV